MTVRPNDVRMHQRGSLPSTCVLRCLGQDLIGGNHVAAIHLLNEQPGESGQEFGDRSPRGIYFHRHRDGIPIVFHQKDDWKLEIGSGVERFPELALTGGTVSGGAKDQLVGLYRWVGLGELLNGGVAE